MSTHSGWILIPGIAFGIGLDCAFGMVKRLSLMRSATIVASSMFAYLIAMFVGAIVIDLSGWGSIALETAAWGGVTGATGGAVLGFLLYLIFHDWSWDRLIFRMTRAGAVAAGLVMALIGAMEIQQSASMLYLLFPMWQVLVAVAISHSLKESHLRPFVGRNAWKANRHDGQGSAGGDPAEDSTPNLPML